MSVIARAKEKLQLSIDLSYMLPVVLGINTALLIAAEQLHGIPSWLKAAAALFLAF